MRSVSTTKRMMGGLVFLSAFGWADPANAQFDVGTWVRTDAQGKGFTLTVEPCCGSGRRLIYHLPVPGQPPLTITVESPFDGTEVPAMFGGKPSGETMAIRRLDDRHFSGVVKMNGQPLGVSNTTLSADGTTATVESVQLLPGGKTDKTIETWVRK